MVTLKLTSVAQGTAHVLTSVKDGIEKGKKLVDVEQMGQIGQITLRLRV